jgi:uncharacterized protein involved in exopolysaccharide biosynthesis
MNKNEQNAVSGPSTERVRPLYVTLASATGSGISLVDLWRALWEGKWLVIGICVLFATAAVIYALKAEPIYRSEIVLAPVGSAATTGASSPLTSLASIAGLGLGGATDQAQIIAMLESRGFTAAFIRDKQLLPVLFADLWDEQTNTWRVEPEEQPDIRDAVKYFGEAVRFVVEDEPRTGLVTLAIEWRDPKLAADWASELVHRLNESARNRDIEESQRKLDYLNREMAKASLVELRQAISRVVEEQINAMMLAQAQQEYAFKIIDPPIVPKQRVWPKRTLIVMVTTFLGGVLGLFVVLSRFAIRRLSTSAAP